ncbi:uncharacterized protein LOC135828147 isoform X2 [Sycon ciliatum]|uniref:uncharacterized protein LOC135828147 isoform X2 n=1 Tax=Sycon ciliatum TaxID=27933 RepID=UPI0031F641C1
MERAGAAHTCYVCLNALPQPTAPIPSRRSHPRTLTNTLWRSLPSVVVLLVILLLVLVVSMAMLSGRSIPAVSGQTQAMARSRRSVSEQTTEGTVSRKDIDVRKCYSKDLQGVNRWLNNSKIGLFPVLDNYTQNVLRRWRSGVGKKRRQARRRQFELCEVLRQWSDVRHHLECPHDQWNLTRLNGSRQHAFYKLHSRQLSQPVVMGIRIHTRLRTFFLSNQGATSDFRKLLKKVMKKTSGASPTTRLRQCECPVSMTTASVNTTALPRRNTSHAPPLTGNLTAESPKTTRLPLNTTQPPSRNASVPQPPPTPLPPPILQPSHLPPPQRRPTALPQTPPPHDVCPPSQPGASVFRTPLTSNCGSCSADSTIFFCDPAETERAVITEVHSPENIPSDCGRSGGDPAGAMDIKFTVQVTCCNDEASYECTLTCADQELSLNVMDCDGL